MTNSRTLASTAFLVLLVSPPACGGGGREMNDMKQLGLAYHNFHDKNARGPKDVDDFLQGTNAEDHPVIKMTAAGGPVVFIWGVNIPDARAGAGNTVLAHQSQVPTSGGIVLFVDGHVERLTAAQFAARPKPPSETKK